MYHADPNSLLAQGQKGCLCSVYLTKTFKIMHYIISKQEIAAWLMKGFILYLFLSFSFFSFASVFPTSGQSILEKRITLRVENMKVKYILKKIIENDSVRFAYLPNEFDVNRKLSLDVQDTQIDKILKIIFGTDLFIKTKGNLIIIKPVPQSVVIDRMIGGKVTDEKGDPVAGVNVLEKGTTNGTMTDADGKFSLKAADENSILVFSSIGYTTQEVTVGGQSSLSISMQPDVKQLEDVVVVGYGTTSRGKITTAIASVKIDEIDKGANYDPVKMLQGRTSGVNVMSSSGIPGSNPVIMVRGVGSITGGSSPLYVVDGMVTDNLPNLNPNDIESMDVLKDASAAAIYGSRANNGVIIIKTKSGKDGRTVVNFTSQVGLGSVYRDIQMANTAEYTQTMQDAITNYNSQMGTQLKLYIPKASEEFNWVKAISRPMSITSQQNINLSGGNEKTTFFTSFGYFKQQGYLKNSDYTQYSFRINLSHKISKFIKLNTNLSGTYAGQNLLEQTSTSLKILRTAREEQPWYSPYDSSGNYKVNGTKILRHNPLMLQNEETWVQKNYQGVGTFSFDITPIKGLKYTPSISVYAILSDEKKKLTEQHAARALAAGWGAIQQKRNENIRYVINNVLSYENTVGKLNYSILGGHEYWYRSYDNIGAYSDNYANNAYPSSNFELLNSGTTIYPTGISYSAYNLESWFARLSLDFDGKYLLNASFRRDGCSKFSKETRYGNFPSVSFAWRVGKEKFFPNQNVLTDLKFRGSIGSTGSIEGISNFASRALVSAGNSYNGQGGIVLTQSGQKLTWEKAMQYDVGLDAEFFNGRLTLIADYFYQETRDLLYNLPIYSTSGFSSIAANIGTLSNQGLEFEVNSKILKGSFKWNAGANITFVQNKLLSLYANSEQYIVPGDGSNLLGGSQHALINGKPISAYYMYNMLGLYQNDSEISERLFAKGVRAGDVKYEDINEDGDITDVDRKYVGKAVPDFYGGFNSTFLWKGFDLNLFCQFSYGGKIIAAWQGINGVEGTDNPAMSPSNVYTNESQTIREEQYFNVRKKYAENYWRGPGTGNTTPRPVRTGVWSGYSNGYNSLSSTRYLEDGSYLKIKTLSLGYTIPASVFKKQNVFQSARIYVTVDNLLTFAKYSGYDPETSFAGNPGESNYGVDFGLEPPLRIFSTGINLKF